LIGGTLLRQTRFDDGFHSTDIETIEGRAYELLVCAGAPAEKWRANKDPEADWANLQRLMGCLAKVSAAHVLLISTVDVYPSPVDVDEETVISPDGGNAYGRHRYRLEEFIRSRFPATCLRLPGLVGTGLKKNVIFDLTHGQPLDNVSPDSRFQFYPLDRLWSDMEIARKAGLGLVNFATEPVSVRDVARAAVGRDFENARAPTPVRYDMRTRHADRFGGSGGYVLDRAAELAAISAYAASVRSAQA
jgi:nucleoside-diphosphate-sugar epimerase